jgi:hypothetical protein
VFGRKFSLKEEKKKKKVLLLLSHSNYTGSICFKDSRVKKEEKKVNRLKVKKKIVN